MLKFDEHHHCIREPLRHKPLNLIFSVYRPHSYFHYLSSSKKGLNRNNAAVDGSRSMYMMLIHENIIYLD